MTSPTPPRRHDDDKTGIPRWAWITGILLVIAIAVIVLMFTGAFGGGGHQPPRGAH